MKNCTVCGAVLEDHASFCTNCGYNVRQNDPFYCQPVVKMPVSVGGWIGRSLIPYIPLVGGIVYLIMLFIWSGDKKKEDTFRNWAKAQLIIMAVILVLTIIVGVVYGAAITEMLSYL